MKIEKPKSIVPKWVVLETEEDPNDNASFYIKPLTKPELAQVQDYVKKDENGDVQFLSQGKYKCIRLGLLDWRNLEDDDGVPVLFSRNWSEVFDFLPDYLVDYLAVKIYTSSLWTEEEEKKLLQRLKSTSTEKTSTAPTVNTENTATNQTQAATQ